MSRFPLFIFFLVLLSACNHTKSISYTNNKYFNSNSQFVDMMGMKVHYRIEGQGQPLVLVHGIGGFLQMWDGWVEELKGEYQIIRMDLPMSGLTGPIKELPTQPDIKIFVNFLKAFLDQQGIQHFHLVGNSLGGWIAWEYAASYPEDVDRLILIDAAGLLENEDFPKAVKLARKKIANLFGKTGVPRLMVRMFYKGAYGDKKNVTKERVTTYYEMLNRTGNYKAFRDLSRLDIPLDKDRVNTIQTPTLIMWGEKDNWIDLKYAYEFKERISGSQIEVFHDLGHVPMEEAPKETAQVAKAFLNAILDEHKD